ncbi:anti-repressor SinI family protein [Peribacillus sp. SCS-26]
MSKIINHELDQEWVELLLQAKKLGIEKEEVREFIRITQEKAKVI